MRASPANPPSDLRTSNAPALSAIGLRPGSSASSASRWRASVSAESSRAGISAAARGKSSVMSKPVFRFAPSPNGHLHLGHAYSALRNFDMARAAGGRLLLRMEDIDTARCRPEFEAAIYEDLTWLGIEWEQPVRRQSGHFDDYRAALAKLAAMRLTFPSFESRAEIAHMVSDRDVRERWPRDPDGVPLYPGAARQMKEPEQQARIERGDPYAIRLDMEKATEWTGPLRSRETGAGPAGESGDIAAE